MADQSKVENNIVSVTGMSVSGGDLPTDWQVFFNVKYDFTDVSVEDLIGHCCGGSSIRVKSQTKLRKWATAELLKYGIQSETGYDAAAKEAIKSLPYFTFLVDTDFEKEATGPQDPVKTANRQLTKMSPEEKIVFLRDAGYEEQADIEQAKLDALLDEEQQSEETE